jgi:3-oxoacyl-[acyl-carrier-protein] synthase II
MKRRRVVVTGFGVVSALGNSPEDLFVSIKKNLSAIRLMDEWNTVYPYTEKPYRGVAAPVTIDPGIEKIIDRKFRRSMGRLSIYAALAAKSAVFASKISNDLLCSGRCGCVMGSTMGSGADIIESSKFILNGRSEELSGMQFFKCVSHTAAFNVANYLGITGCLLSPSAACASGLQAVGVARDLIAYGTQDIVVCGGADEVTPEVCGSFEALFATASDIAIPSDSSRPFSADRSGLVCGDGAGVLILEEYEHAVRRNAPIYGEILGYATCCSGAQLSQSERKSIKSCMNLALADAALTAVKIDYVGAHATGTIAGDGEEAMAIKDIFGDNVPVSSLKGHLGHTLGASGVIELIAADEMMRRDTLLPTRNLKTVAEDCAGINHVQALRYAPARIMMKNCFAFGGVNSALIYQSIP